MPERLLRGATGGAANWRFVGGYRGERWSGVDAFLSTGYQRAARITAVLAARHRG